MSAAPPRTLDDALYALLFDHRYRERFLVGDRAALGLSHDDVHELDAIDRHELGKTAERIAADLLKGNFEGNGGLRAGYPGVFEALAECGRPIRDLLFEFLASAEYERYRELPFAGRGTCIEEAFFRFLREDEVFVAAASTNSLLLVHEFLTVMMSLLAVTPEPNFDVASRELIQHNGCAWWATQTYPAPIVASLTGMPPASAGDSATMLYAASANRTFVRGVIDEAALDVLRRGTGAGKIADGLADLGLIAE
jgi:hypothetical protein